MVTHPSTNWASTPLQIQQVSPRLGSKFFVADHSADLEVDRVNRFSAELKMKEGLMLRVVDTAVPLVMIKTDRQTDSRVSVVWCSDCCT